MLDPDHFGIGGAAGGPLFDYSRQRESELRRDLREMKDAIDRYKDAADRNLIRVEVGSEGYPPDLETLVKGVQVGASADKKIRFLRKIPVDPMTGQAEWGLRAVQDDPDSTELGRQKRFRRVFEVAGHGARRNQVFGLVSHEHNEQSQFPAGRSHARKSLNRRSGFTLIELMIVMTIILILIGIAAGNLSANQSCAAKEAVLKEDLQEMRKAIDNYTMDKQAAPQSLDDLVPQYLRILAGRSDYQQQRLGCR